MTHTRLARRRGHAYFGSCLKDKLPQRNAHFHHRNTPSTISLKHHNRPTREVADLRVAQNGLKHHKHGVNALAGNSGSVLSEPRKRATPAKHTSKRQFPWPFIMGAKRARLAHTESAHRRWHRFTNKQDNKFVSSLKTWLFEREPDPVLPFQSP
jgi:hypothetical protein